MLPSPETVFTRLFPLKLCFTRKIPRNPTDVADIPHGDTAQASPGCTKVKKQIPKATLFAAALEYYRAIAAFSTIVGGCGSEALGFSPLSYVRTVGKTTKHPKAMVVLSVALRTTSRFDISSQT